MLSSLLAVGFPVHRILIWPKAAWDRSWANILKKKKQGEEIGPENVFSATPIFSVCFIKPLYWNPGHNGNWRVCYFPISRKFQKKQFAICLVALLITESNLITDLITDKSNLTSVGSSTQKKKKSIIESLVWSFINQVISRRGFKQKHKSINKISFMAQ